MMNIIRDTKESSLELYMTRQGLSIVAFAAEFSKHFPDNTIQFSTVATWLRGEVCPHRRTLKLLAEMLEVDVVALKAEFEARRDG